MAAYVIWLDFREAKVFKLQPGGPQVSHHKVHGHKHPTQPFGKHPGSHHPESEGMFSELVTALKDATEILLVGPGEAKTAFQTHLKKHHDKTLAPKIVGVETVDHPTDNQVLEIARKFFKNHDLFT